MKKGAEEGRRKTVQETRKKKWKEQEGVQKRGKKGRGWKKGKRDYRKEQVDRRYT